MPRFNVASRGNTTSRTGNGRNRAGARMAIAVLLFAANAFATAAGAAPTLYHVDNGNPSCSSVDPARGSAAVPYCTIAQAVTEKGGPDVTLLVHPGTYREQVIVSASGAAGTPFTIQATGPGVIVDGSDAVIGWTNFSGDVWQVSGITWTPRRVFSDGVGLSLSSQAPPSMAAGTFWYDAGTMTLYVNIGGDPNTHTILVSRRDHCFRLTNQSFVTLDGFDLVRANRNGVMLTGGSNQVISRNRVFDHGDHGLNLNTATAMQVVGNECFRNARLIARAANGIILQGCSNSRIENNRLYLNEDTGLQINLGSSGNLSIQNRSWLNGDHGLDHLNSTGTVHIGDVAWRNFMDGFSVEGTSTGTQLFDCVAVDNGITASPQGANLRVEAAGSPGFTSDYNIFWNSTLPNRIEYSTSGPTVIYTSLAAYQAASGQDPHSLEADPKFVDAPNGDFHLLAGSPAIDAGTSVPLNWPSADADGHVREDDPATPNTGAAGFGRPDFADRGAFEFVPPPPPPPPTAENLCKNPSFETDIAGWDRYNASLQRIQGSAKDGQYYLKVTDNSSATAFGVNDSPNIVEMSPAPGTRYRYSMWVRSATGHGPVRLLIREYVNGVRQGGSTYSPDVPLGPDWAQVTVERVTLAGNSSLDLKVLDEVQGETFDLDDVHVEVVGAPGNQPPTASLAILPSSSGVAPFDVTADASGSMDDVGIVSYTFDFGDGTVLPPQPGPTATHTYLAGTWTAKVTVTDTQGVTDVATVQVNVTPDGVTNLCGNPSFETSIAGYSPSSGSTLVQGNGGHDGTHSLEIHGPANTSAMQINDSPNWVAQTPSSPGARFRFIAWVRSPSTSGSTARIRIREYLNGSNVGQRTYSSPVTLNAAWQQLGVDYVTAAGNSSLDFNVVIDPVAAANEVVQVDDIVITQIAPGALPASGSPAVAAVDREPLRFAAAVVPNPVSAAGTFEFTVTRPQTVRLQVFDAAGRRMRTPLDAAFLAAGRHRVALGDARRPLAAGLYFYALQAEEGTLRGRFAVLP